MRGADVVEVGREAPGDHRLAGSTHGVVHLRRQVDRELSRLAPFGAGNPEPVFGCPELLAHEVRVLSSRRGAGDGPGHLKLRLLAPPEQGSTPTAADRPHARDGVFDAIGFGLGGLSVQRGARLAAAFQLSLDRFGGDERLQLKLKDLREPGIS